MLTIFCARVNINVATNSLLREISKCSYNITNITPNLISLALGNKQNHAMIWLINFSWGKLNCSLYKISDVAIPERAALFKQNTTFLNSCLLPNKVSFCFLRFFTVIYKHFVDTIFMRTPQYFPKWPHLEKAQRHNQGLPKKVINFNF